MLLTSVHCHNATPSAPPEMITVAMVATRTRSGLDTSDARPRRTTAPPIMMMGGRMASQRMDGTVMVFDAAWAAAACLAAVVASRDAITWFPPRPGPPPAARRGPSSDSTWAISWLTDGLMRSSTGLG